MTIILQDTSTVLKRQYKYTQIPLFSLSHICCHLFHQILQLGLYESLGVEDEYYLMCCCSCWNCVISLCGIGKYPQQFLSVTCCMIVKMNDSALPVTWHVDIKGVLCVMIVWQVCLNVNVASRWVRKMPLCFCKYMSFNGCFQSYLSLN